MLSPETASAVSSGLTLPGIVGIIGGVLGIIGIVASAAAVLRANYMRATIDTLKESNSALTERNDQLDADIKECTQEIVTLKAENASLQNYVSGTEAVTKLGQQLHDQHIEQMATLIEMAETFKDHVIVDHPRNRPAARRAPAKKTTTRRKT